MRKLPEGVGEGEEVEEAEREGKSGEERNWEREKERVEEEVCNWKVRGEARSRDAMTEFEDNPTQRDKA